MQQPTSATSTAPGHSRRQQVPTGSKTKYCQFKLRVAYPLDDYTAAVHGAGTGSATQYQFLGELESQLQFERMNIVPVSLTVNKQQSKLFKPADGELRMVALLQVEVAYSALHGMCTKDFIEHAQVSLREGYYPSDALELSVVRS